MAEEEDEQGQLLGRQVQGMAGPLGLLRRQVHPHVAIGERRDLDRPPAADQGAGAGEQLVEGERLAQVVVGPAVEAAHPVADRVARREEEHGRRPALAAMALQDLQAVRAGQPPVEDDEVPVAGPQRLPGRVAVGGVRDGEALVRQTVDDRSGEARVVLDEQDPLFHDRPASCRRRSPPAWTGRRRLRLQHSRPIGGRRVRQMKRISCAGPTIRPGGATMKGILGFLAARARGPDATISWTTGRPAVADGAGFPRDQDAEHG